MPVASELLVRINADTGNLESGLSRADKQVSGFAKGAGMLGSVGTAAFVGLGVAAVGLGAGIGSAINSAADFQATISKVAAVSGASQEELAGLSSLALKMGKDTSFSAGEAAQAMRELAAGGIEVADMAAVLPGTLDLAAAGGLGLAEAATIATDTMSIFAKQGVTMDKVANAFAGAANISSISVQDMAESMKYVGPVAAAMGLSLEDTSAAVALLGANGLKGSQAGTGLRTMLVSLASPSKEAAKLMRSLGLEVFDSQGKIKDFAGISNELKDSLKGMTDQQRLATLETLFGREGMSAAIAVMGEGENSIEAYTDKLANATSAHDTGVKMLDNFRGKMEELKGSVETGAIMLGTALLPALQRVVTGLTGGVNALLPFIEAWGPKLAAGLGAAISALVGFGQRVASVIAAVIGAFQALFSGQINFSQFVGGIQNMVAAVAGNLGQLASRAAPYLQAFFASVGAFIATAAPQIATQMGLWAGAFTDWLTTTAIPFLAPRLGAFLTAINTWVTGTAAPAIGQAMLALAQGFTSWLTTTAIPFLATNLPLWLQSIATWITGTVLPTLGALFGPVGQAFGGWLTGTAIPYLQTNLPLWLTAISTWITGTALPAIGTALATVGTAFGDWVATTAVPWVTANLPGWWAAISTWITTVAIPAATATLDGLGKALGDWIATSAVPYLQANFPAFATAVATGLTGILTQINDFATLAGVKVNEWIKSDAAASKWAAMQTETDTGLAGILNSLNSFSVEAGPKLNKWIEESGPKWLTSWSALGEAAGEGYRQIDQAIGEINASIGRLLTEGLEAITPSWSHSWDALGTAVQTALSKMGTDISAELGRIGGQLNTWLASVTPSWLHSWDELGTAVRNALDKMVQAITSGGAQMSGSMGAAMAGIVLAVIGGLAQMVSGAISAMANFASAIVGGLAGIAGQAGAAAAGIGAAIVSGIAGALSAGAGTLAGIASNMVNSALEAAKGALGIHSPSREFAYVGEMAIQGLIEGMDDKKLDAMKKAADVASAVSKAAMDAMAAGAAIAAFDFAKNSPAGDQLGWLSHLVTSMVATIQDAAKDFNEKGLKATTEFADAMGKVGSSIKSALDGLAALAKYNFADGSPTGSAMGWFAHLVTSIVATMQEAARDFDSVGLKAVSEFSDAASKVTSLVKSGADALKALSSYADPPRAAIYAFGKTIRALINDVALIAEQVTQEATDAAAKFAEGAGKVVGILGAGVEGFRKLGDYTAIPTAAIYAFGKSLRAVINDFALLSEQITPAATAAAALFAEGAGKVVGILGSGVSGFAALSTYSAPAASAIYEFGKTIRLILNDFALLAEQITQEATDKAGVFAGGVGEVVGVIGGAVEGLSKLASFVAPSQAAIDQFVYAVNAIVAKMADMAGNFRGDALAKATEFATSAKAVFDATKGALDTFGGFKDMVVPSAGAIDALVIGMQYVTARMSQVANEIGAKGLSQAQAFGTAVAAVFGSLKTAIDTMDKLKGFKDNATIVFDALVVGMQEAITRAQELVGQAKGLQLEAEEYLANMEAAARAFAKGAAMGGLGGPAAAAGASLGESVASGARDALDSHSPSKVMASIGNDVVSGLVKGMDDAQQDAAKKAADVASAVAGAIQSTLAALGAVAGFNAGRGPSGGQIAAVLDYTKGLVAGMAEAAGLISEEGLKATDAYAKGASAVVDTFGKAADLLAKLGAYVAPSATALYDVGKALKAAINDFAVIAELVGTEMLTLAAGFAEGAGKVAEAVGKGAEGLSKLATYVEAPTTAIYALGKALRLAVQDFAAIADQLDTSVVGSAATFADGAGKVADVVGKGAAALTLLKDYVDPPVAAVYAFGKTIRLLVSDFAGMAALVGKEGVEAAGKFGDAASKAVGVLGNGVSGITALATFVAPAQATMDAFLVTIRYVVAKFGEMATILTEEGAKQTTAFGTAAASALGAVKAGVDAFAILDETNMPTNGKIDDLLRSVSYVTERVAAVAASIGSEAIADAQAFGTAASAIFSALKSGLDLFIQIDKPGNWPQTDWLQPLIELMGGVLQRGSVLLSQAQQLEGIANAFGAAMGRAGAGFSSAIAGGGNLALAGGVPVGLPSGTGGTTGGTTVVNVYVTGNTVLGEDYATGAKLAAVIAPELRRLIGV